MIKMEGHPDDNKRRGRRGIVVCGMEMMKPEAFRKMNAFFKDFVPLQVWPDFARHLVYLYGDHPQFDLIDLPKNSRLMTEINCIQWKPPRYTITFKLAGSVDILDEVVRLDG